MTTETKFTEAGARRAAIRMILKGDGGANSDTVILAAILEAQEEEIKAQGDALRYQGEAFREFRALVCRVAWALLLPNVESSRLTSLGRPSNGVPISPSWHVHAWAEDDAIEALKVLAAYDTSGYAPPAREPPPDGGSNREHPLYGYQSDERGGRCDDCGEPPDSHGCPEEDR